MISYRPAEGEPLAEFGLTIGILKAILLIRMSEQGIAYFLRTVELRKIRGGNYL